MKEEITSIWEAFVGFIKAIVNTVLSGTSHAYKASFGTTSSFMKKGNEGFSVTGSLHMSMKQSFEHLAVVSPSGGGKTTVCIVPTILRQTNSSLIINDNSKEIRKVTANYLHRVGYRVVYLDFDREHFTTDTAYYNPLARIRSKADIAKITSILVKQASSDNGKDKFWSLSSSEVISLAVQRVLLEPDSRTHHLASVYHYIQQMIADEDRMSFDLAQYDDLFTRWQILLSNSSNTKASIFSSAIAALSWVDTNPNLGILTSRDTVDFATLREEKTALFISVPLAYEEVYMPLVNCFYAQFFSSILECELPANGVLPILCLLDEFGSSMHIPGFNKYASNLRKWNVGLMLILQTEAQLEKYGKSAAKEILNSCSKVYFTGLDDEAEKISRLLGKYHYKAEKDVTKERLLMTPDEVRTMPKNQAIVVPNGGLKPMKSKLIPYYQQRELMKRSDMECEEEEEVVCVSPELHLIRIPELPESLRHED